MGAATFIEYEQGNNVSEAFSEATAQARYKYGHDGYTGTLAEKGDYQVVPGGPVPEQAAYWTAEKLLDDPRYSDKWGPAYAIPVIAEDRKVQVEGFRYDDATDDLAKVVRPLVKLAAGESIKDVDVFSYSSVVSHSSKRINCAATVRIARRPFLRIVEVTPDLPASADRAKEQAVELAKAKVRLRKGERIMLSRVTTVEPVHSRAKALATKGKSVTRHVVNGSQRHSTWETGFDTQAQARARAVEALNAVTYPSSLDIQSVTRREDGSPLVRVSRPVKGQKATVLVALDTGLIKNSTEVGGSVFFGWASS